MKKLLGLLLVFGAFQLQAAQIPANFGYEKLDDFSYGLVTTPDSGNVTKKAATKMRNCYIDKKPGSIVQGSGWSVMGTASGVSYFRYGWDFIKSDGSKKFLIFGSTSATPTATSGILVETADFSSFTVVKAGLSAILDLDSAQVFYKRWFTNGSDAVFTWDGTTVQTLDGTYPLPNVPKGKYISFYQRSVWVYNLSDNDSQARFSAPVDTTPAALAQNPDTLNAWPAVNGLNFDRGNGEVGTFIRVFKGKLFVGKDRSIYFVSGIGASSYQPVKVSYNVGFLYQFSTFELDSYLYGHSYDGFYRFDGTNSERLSDDIFPDIQAIRTDTVRNISDTWESESDFRRGLFYGTTVSPTGVLSMSTETRFDANVNAISFLSGDNDTLSAGQETGFRILVPTLTFPTDTVYKFSDPPLKLHVSGCGAHPCSVAIMNTNTLASATGTFTPTGGTQLITINLSDFSNLNTSFTATELANGNLRINAIAGVNCSVAWNVFKATTMGGALIALTPVGRNYISDVATISLITTWGLFGSVNTTDSGSNSFYIRTATSIVQLSTAEWTAISAGAVINSPTTHKYTQWAASVSYPATIDNVTIDHIEGTGSNTRSFGVAWLNRPWFGVSTETTGNYPIIYVMSRRTNPNPHAWMPFDAIPVRGFLSSGQILYGFHGSEAKVLRLDNGTNYGGAPIHAYYETPDMTLGDYAFKKDIWEYELDLQKESGATLTLGTSLNSRAFGTNSISLNGSGPLFAVVRNPNGGGGTYCNTVKLRFENSTLDKGMQINGASIIYRKTLIR